MYEEEEAPLFWESVDELDALEEASDSIAAAVRVLAYWAVQDPKRAPVDSDGIRILKLPSTYLAGDMTPPLRLAYNLLETQRPSGASGVVTLLHIAPYDDADERAGNVVPPYIP